jgi:hypothetical protein
VTATPGDLLLKPIRTPSATLRRCVSRSVFDRKLFLHVWRLLVSTFLFLLEPLSFISSFHLGSCCSGQCVFSLVWRASFVLRSFPFMLVHFVLFLLGPTLTARLAIGRVGGVLARCLWQLCILVNMVIKIISFSAKSFMVCRITYRTPYQLKRLHHDADNSHDCIEQKQFLDQRQVSKKYFGSRLR